MADSPTEDHSGTVTPGGDFADLRERIDQHARRLSEHARELRRLRDDLDDLDQRFRSA
jgi:chromosome segregation ATPase